MRTQSVFCPSFTQLILAFYTLKDSDYSAKFRRTAQYTPGYRNALCSIHHYYFCLYNIRLFPLVLIRVRSCRLHKLGRLLRYKSEEVYCKLCYIDYGPQLSLLISAEQLMRPLVRVDKQLAVALLHFCRCAARSLYKEQSREKVSLIVIFCLFRHGEATTRQSAFLLRTCRAFLSQKRISKGKTSLYRH